MPLTDNDRRIIADMQDTIARIERAIAGKADHELTRPLIGDAHLRPVSSWKADIQQNRRWIAEIEQGAN